MTTLQIQIEGVGVWAAGLSDYRQLQTLGSDARPSGTAAPARPPALTLSANERRRAPEGVLLAVEVADQAIRMSGRAADELLSVFSSCRGDQAITDYMCRTLAEDPLSLSPTKFHNSVHNAPAGYWAIANGAMGASSAISTESAWSGLGLLDAMTLAMSEQQPVLWVCSETRGSGPLLQLSGYTSGMACALVLAPAVAGHGGPRLNARLVTAQRPLAEAGHAVSSLLPWLAGLEQGGHSVLPVAPHLALEIDGQAGRLS
ncbi:beta-ketoacyl synthase chain length factor [Frateuria aurantia]